MAGTATSDAEIYYAKGEIFVQLGSTTIIILFVQRSNLVQFMVYDIIIVELRV